jgi:hypothetical protein
MNPQTSSFGMVIDHLHRSQEKRWGHLIVFADGLRGDLASPTVAGRPSDGAPAGLRDAATIDYRKEGAK